MPFSPRLRLLPWIAVGLVVLLVGLHSLRGGSGGDADTGSPRALVSAGSGDAAESGGLAIGSSDRALVIDVAGAGGAPISLSSATAEQLEQIEGIGPVTAADIIEFRDSKGGLSSIDQIDEVSGIGPVTMEALRSSLQP